MSDHQPLQSALREHGYSLTKARAHLFKVLAQSEPLTMNELAKQCTGVMDRASVYRTVTLFEQLSIVQRLQIGWKYKLELSNAFQAHHHHLTCLGCGSVTALPEDSRLEEQLIALAEQYQFTTLDHQLEISGYCPACQALQKT